jgi:hypothetical protein
MPRNGQSKFTWFGVFRDEGRERLARMSGLPGAAVADAHVLHNVTAGPEPHAVGVGVHVSGDDDVPG